MALILVVEDENYLLGVIGEMLEQGGHDVILAQSVKEALRFCQERALDLVITDLVMPDMDGLELIRSLRQSHSKLPVVVISGAFNGLLKVATALGAVGTISKPFTPVELLATVDKSLGKQTKEAGE